MSVTESHGTTASEPDVPPFLSISRQLGERGRGFVFPLARWLGDLLERPAVLCNDADVAGLAEALFGAGKGFNPVFYITLGSGIGGGLVQGGADLIIIETAQDILEVKAAIFGARQAFKDTGRTLPIQISVSLLPNGGKMLLGTDIQSVLTTMTALEELRSPAEVAKLRGLSVSEVLGTGNGDKTEAAASGESNGEAAPEPAEAS